MNSNLKSTQTDTTGNLPRTAARFAAGRLAPIAILVLVSLAIYYNSLSNGFVFDGYAVIVENKSLKDFSGSLPAIFSKSYFKIAGGESSYRPIATFSYFLIHAFAGLNPFYYHLSSVLLHTLNALFVYYLSCLLLGDRFNAFLVGILFVCHPALTEAVDCIAFNEDLLAAFFYLLAFILYVKALDMNSPAVFRLLSLLFYFCGMLSKEIAVTLPVMIVLYDLTFRGEDGQTLSARRILKTVERKWPLYVGYALIGLLYLVLRFVIFVKPGDGLKPHYGSLFERLLYLPNHIFNFIKLAFAPYDLNVDYVFSYPQRFFDVSHLGGFVIVVGLVIFSFFLFKNYKEIFFGFWWFLITLFPVFNIIEIFNPFAERYLYIPIIGFCLVLPVLLWRLFSKILTGKKAVRAVTLAAVLVLSGTYATVTVARNRDWKDGLTLWSKTVQQSPNSGVAHGSLGLAYQEQGRLEEAIAAYETAVRLMPNHYKAFYNLGLVYGQKGDFKNAVENYKKSIKSNPAFANAHFNLASIYHQRGLIDDAIRHYRRVIELVPEDFEARNNLGVAYAMQGKLEQAIREWENVLEIDPANPSAQDNIHKARVQLERAN